ncbi:MAG: response regulator transcription factor [Hyphomicrobiales bacterium]
MKNIKILLVDDEDDIIEFLRYNLVKEGFEVSKANNGIKALELAKKVNPDIIVLDVMMPEMDGIETCYELRKIPSLKNTIITFLTSRAEDYSQIAGFEAGADDYIKKPIRPKLFVSRIKALLRRSENSHIDNTKTITDNLSVDREKYEVLKDGKPVLLPKKEFELLSLLTSKPGKVFTREEIFECIWGDDLIIGDRTIDVHIRKLRKKIGLLNIKTYKGVGYSYNPNT